MTMILSGEKSLSVNNLDVIKKEAIKADNIKKCAQKVGVDYLKI
jgi:hypothetical protein